MTVGSTSLDSGTIYYRSPAPAKTPDDPRPPPYYEVQLGERPWQAWDVATAIVERLPVSFAVGHPLAIAIEYIIRAGRKKPDTLRKDLVKARNALDRAISQLEPQ